MERAVEILPLRCDHTSIGVIIRNEAGKIALLKRAKFPVGIAPAAGHIDDHGSSERAAVTEVYEELGLIIAVSGLDKTVIENRRIDNQCRRPNGNYHNWTVYEVAEWSGELIPGVEETKGAGWYSLDQLQGLGVRTRAYRGGLIAQDVWKGRPGLEDVWLDFFVELGYIQ